VIRKSIWLSLGSVLMLMSMIAVACGADEAARPASPDAAAAAAPAASAAAGPGVRSTGTSARNPSGANQIGTRSAFTDGARRANGLFLRWHTYSPPAVYARFL